jgi:hypothetical protein
MLGLLAGHRRYAHITALRGDAVAAQALGMGKVISEDALRRALERIDEAASAAWTSVTFTAVDSTLGSGLAVGLTITSARQHAFNPRCVNRPSGARQAAIRNQHEAATFDAARAVR